VIEHLSPHEIADNFNKIKNILSDKGKIIISIPNVFYLGNIYHSTYEHQNNYSFYDIAYFLQKCGYEVIDVSRLNKKILKYDLRIFFRFFRALAQQVILRSFSYTDNATDILITARKN
jgi:hypothetical protein